MKWILCLHVELMFQDGLPSDMQRRMILESLLSPNNIINNVKLGSHSSPHDYIRLLQSAYGLDDGEEIFGKVSQ